MKKILVILIVAVLCFGTVFAQAATEEAGTKTLKLGTTGATTGVLYKAAVWFADKVSEVSGGKLTVEVVGAGALGTTAQHYAQLREGSLDIFITAFDTGTTLQGGEDFAACVCPYIFRDAAHFAAFQESDVLKAMLEKVEGPNGIKYLGGMGNDFPRCLSATKPITKVDDVVNLKIRVPETAAMMKVWEAWGANPMIIASKETYTALQSGMCDAQENSLQTAYNNGWLEVAKYFMPIEYVQQGNVLYMSAKTVEKLSAQEMAWVDEARKQANAEFNAWMQESYNALVETAKAAGVVFVDVDKQSFMDKAAVAAKEMDGVLWSAGLYDKIAAIGK